MRIKRKTAARLASISALGAGALGVAAGTAEAGIISHTFPHGTVVGPDGASSVPVFCLPAYNSTYPNAFRIARTTFNEGNSTGGFKGWAVFASGDGVRFQGGSVLDILCAGAKWSNSLPYSFGGLIAARGRFTYMGATTYSSVNGNGRFRNKYALFEFETYGQTDYGWLELSNYVSDTAGPDVRLEAYAYDDSGALIAAGDEGGSAAPEPNTQSLTGLAALVMGAEGLRRWRAARKRAA